MKRDAQPQPTLLIDMQSAQSASRFRGLGRYTVDLTTAILKRAVPTWEVRLVFSPLVAAGLGADLASKAPTVDPGVWLPSATWDPTAVRINAELLKDALGQASVVLFPSLFEALNDPSVATPDDRSGLEHATCVAVIHDLIPLIFPERYLTDPVFRAWYHRKLRMLRDCDLLFADSETSKRDAMVHLDVPGSRIVVTRAGVSNLFRVLQPSEQDNANHTLRNLGIERPFILYCGAADWRKNQANLIRAYARLSREARSTHRLVLAGQFDQSEIRTLSEIGRVSGLSVKEIIFTGYVTDTTLRVLYNACSLFVFPSLYEGFGLPVLEAIRCGAPVLASRVASLPEIVGRDDCLFDPAEPTAIAERMTYALEHDGWRRDVIAFQMAHTEQFTWDRTAEVALRALEGRTSHQANRRACVRRPRVAYFSPLPPARSGICGYSTHLVGTLARAFEITLVSESPAEVTNPDLVANHRIIDVPTYEATLAADTLPLFQVGNSPFHSYMLPVLFRHGGVVVLHEVALDSLGWHLHHTLPGGLAGILRDAPASEHLTAAIATAADNSDTLRGVLNDMLVDSIVLSADAVIVHSASAADRLRARPALAGTSLEVVPSAISPAPRLGERERQHLRSTLGLTDCVVAAFGLLDPIKGLDRLLDAVAQISLNMRPRLVFVGDGDPEYKRQLLQRAQLMHIQLDVTGYVDDERFGDYMQAADIVAALRERSRGETSAATLQALAHGKPTIVNDIGPFADLPESAVVKVPSGDTAALTSALLRLLGDATLRTSLSQSAIACVDRQFAWQRVADSYQNIVAQSLTVRNVRRQRASRIAALLVGRPDLQAVVSSALGRPSKVPST